MYFDIDYSKLRTALENDSAVCKNWGIPSIFGRPLDLAMPINSCAMLSFEHMCATASISDDERVKAFAEGVKLLAAELSNGTFTVSESAIEYVTEMEKLWESKYPKTRTLSKNTASSSDKPDVDPELDAAYGVRWGLYNVLKKTYGLIDRINSRKVARQLYEGSGLVLTYEFKQARINALNNILDVFNKQYELVNNSVMQHKR